MPWERYASGVWLTPRLMTFSAVLMLAGGAVLAGYLFATSHGTLDAFGRPLGTDFSSFWTAGRMALHGEALLAYDWPSHFAVQRDLHGTGNFQAPWSYPPMFLMVAAGFATIPYVPSLLIWQAATLLLATVVLRAILPAREAFLIALAYPAVLICILHGQTAFLVAALLAGGILLLPRNEVLAGILFGLLTFKPQFGLILPFALLAGGYWRAILAAAASFGVVLAATLAVWGWGVWQAFFDSLPLTRAVVFESGDTGFHKFQSVFAWLRLLGLPVGPAYAVQALVAVGVLVVCLWIWRGRASLRLKGAALMVGSLLASPYVLDYDLVVLGMALALFAAHGHDHGFLSWERTVLALAWIAPLLARGVTQASHLPLGFLMLATMFLMTLRRIMAERETSTIRPNSAPAIAIPG